MENVNIITGQFLLVYGQEFQEKYKQCFLEEIGATVIKEIGIENELEIDVVHLSDSNELWPELNLELDAERIATRIELLAGHQVTCIPDKDLGMDGDLDNTKPILYRGTEGNDQPNVYKGNAFPLENPNDEYFPAQWSISATKVDQVWKKYGQLGTGVTIAVFDSGVDMENPDLQTNVIPGYNFTVNPVSRDVFDIHGHGTKVAGVIGATTNNTIGIASIAPGAKVMPFKISQYDDKISFINIALSNFIHACTFIINQSISSGRNLVDIINLSFSWNVFNSTEIQLAEQCIESLWELGIVVVAAAGNSGNDLKEYPAAFKRVLSVGGINQMGRKWVGSNYGPSWVYVAAPAVDIITTTNSLISPYAAIEGTSIAAPIVSGILALMLGYINFLGIVPTEPSSKAKTLIRVLDKSSVKNTETALYWKSGIVDALGAMDIIANSKKTM